MTRAARYAVALALLAAVPASGAPARCRQVVDPSGDGRPLGVAPNVPALDVLSADVATGRTSMAAIVRLASLAPDPALAGGATYRVTWRAGPVVQLFELHRFTNGDTLAFFDPDLDPRYGRATPVPATVDVAAGTITWRAPRSLNPELAKRRVTLTELTVRAFPAPNVAVHESLPYVIWTQAAVSGDLAESAAAYPDRAPTCLPVA